MPHKNMPPLTLTYRPAFLRCLTLGGGLRRAERELPPRPLRRQDDCASARSSAYGTLPIIGATKERKDATANQVGEDCKTMHPCPLFAYLTPQSH